MDPQIVQYYRYKLQKRVYRLNSVENVTFIPILRQFWKFFDGNSPYSGIVEKLVLGYPNLSETIDRIFQGKGEIGETEEEAAAIGYKVMRRLAENGDRNVMFSIGNGYKSVSNVQEALEIIRGVFLEPFYEYVDESLDDQRAMLAILFRYKHRSEWFYRKQLWKIIEEESGKAEKLLAIDLYSYLHDQGIDFIIEPSSMTGEIDLIADQDTEDPLLVETKIFDGKNRSKSYIRKGFNQIYTYTQQYNEPFGYLVIFKATDKDLRFSLSTRSKYIPVVEHNHKMIFLLTIDIYPHPKPVSQRGPLQAIEITEKELISHVE